MFLSVFVCLEQCVLVTILQKYVFIFNYARITPKYYLKTLLAIAWPVVCDYAVGGGQEMYYICKVLLTNSDTECRKI